MKPKIIVIVGPTASGKTSLSIRLAKHFGGEVISADSRQVYKGLDIGTGKVTKREMGRITHHLLSVASPKNIFTAAKFVALSKKAASEIYVRNKVPILCGGTGFYIDAFLGRIALPEVPPNSTLRRKLELMSTPSLYSMLQQIDPRRAATIDRYNPRRLVRALEIANAIGRNPDPSSSSDYDVLWIGLEWPKEELYSRIRSRLVSRIRAGMISEARRLHAQGLSYKRMESLGLEYRYMARYLQGKITKNDMIEDLYREICHYAKRQIVSWRRNKSIYWLQPGETEKASAHCHSFLNEIGE